MSTSERSAPACDFDRWIVKEFMETGAFTALIVLVKISEARVTPLCSTYLNVVGDEVEWSEMTLLFAGAGTDLNGAAFFPVVGTGGGPLDNPLARLRLRELEERINENRLVLNDGHFFDNWGRRLRIEEAELH